MSNVLYLDDSAVAGAAMKGILTRARHRCVIALTAAGAWQRLRELVQFDLVILELQLEGENGTVLIKQLRANSNLKDIPVVVYSRLEDRATVHRTIALGLQGYFIKPFDEAVVQREVKKAADFPWRKLLFEEEKSFCAQMGIQAADLRKQREELLASMEAVRPAIARLAASRDLTLAIKLIEPLAESAEGSGVWAIANPLQALRAQAEEGHWTAFEQAEAELEFARRLTLDHLNPGQLPDGFLSAEEIEEKAEAGERTRWLTADAAGKLPLAMAGDVKTRLDELTACPAVESAAASFAMRADGKATSLTPLMDLVARDPGLAVQVLVGANQIPREEKMVVDDPRAAVALLGEIRLRAMARTITAIPARYMNFPPFGWPEFWMFQVGTAHLAKFICEYLELEELAPSAHALGLTHDVGKLLLASLFPFALEAAAKCAKDRSLPFEAAARRLVGLSTREIGSHFVREHGLPAVFGDVMAGVDAPEKAEASVPQVAVVALARHLCLQHRVGHNGESLGPARIPVEQTEAWAILRSRAFPSFELRKFESAAQALCLNLKPELIGREHVFRTSKGG